MKDLVIPLGHLTLDFPKHDIFTVNRVLLNTEANSKPLWFYDFRRSIEENKRLCLRLLYIAKSVEEEHRMAKDWDFVLNNGQHIVTDQLSAAQFFKPHCNVVLKKKEASVLGKLPMHTVVRPNDLLLKPSQKSKPIFKVKPREPTQKKAKPLFVTQRRV